MTLTFAIPKPTNKLSKPFNDLLQCGGFEYQSINKDEGRIVDKTGDLPDISAIVLRTKDALDDLCDGQIALATVGGDTLLEFNLATGRKAPLSTTKITQESICTFCLAGKKEDNLIEKGLSATKGRTIVTSYPEILADKLNRAGIVSTKTSWEGNQPDLQGIDKSQIATIIVRRGGVERKAATIDALVFDIVETGGTLRRNGFDTDTKLPIETSSLLFVESRSDKQRLQQTAQEKRAMSSFLDRVPETVYGKLSMAV